MRRVHYRQRQFYWDRTSDGNLLLLCVDRTTLHQHELREEGGQSRDLPVAAEQLEHQPIGSRTELNAEAVDEGRDDRFHRQASSGLISERPARVLFGESYALGSDVPAVRLSAGPASYPKLHKELSAAKARAEGTNDQQVY